MFMPLKLLHTFYGFLFSVCHFVITVVFGVYFGLGMSRSGAWFTKNIIMQPGAFIVTLFSNADSQMHRYILLINFVFYWIIAALFFYLRNRKGQCR